MKKDTHNRLFLIGPMGAGKSSLGKLVAHDLGFRFIDSDKVIEENTGVDIPTIFYYEKEDGFRKRETEAINALTQYNRIVLATGGGAILKPLNRGYLQTRGCVIYLKVSVEQQLARTSRDTSRPLLQTENPRMTLEKIAAKRSPIYESISDFSIDTDTENIHVIRSRIRKAYHQYKKQAIMDTD